MKILKWTLFVLLVLTPLWLLGGALALGALFPGPYPY
jgi:hypothetical protein